MHRVALVLLLALLIIGCAQQSSPSGGAKDEIAPRDTILVPPNYSVKFNSKTIYIEFDEYIRLNDIYSQLVISPPFKSPPEVKVQKKAVILTLQEDLLPQTTYTLNFGEGVVDYNEGNPAVDLVYVFSTGDELDSMAFHCEVIDAFSAENLEGIKVMLYDSEEDSIPFKEKPRYFGRTDKQGKTLIKNIRQGAYKVCLLEDQNGNYIVDPGEPFGFAQDLIPALPLDSNLTLHKLAISKPLDTLQFITDYARDSAGHVRMVFNSEKIAPSFLVLGNPSRKTQWCWSGDSLHVWLEGESTNADFDLEISSFGEVLDTLSLLDYKTKPTGAYELSHNIKGKQRSDSLLWISSYDLISALDTSRFSLTADSLDVSMQIVKSSDSRKIYIEADLVEGRKYEFIALPGAIMSRTGWQNDTLHTRFSTFEKSYFGQINLAISGLNYDHAILEILNTKESLVFRKNITKDTLIHIPGLLPDAYVIRLIIDENNNGQWDPVDYWIKRSPEEIFYFPQEVNMRSNWTLEYDWILNASY